MIQRNHAFTKSEELPSGDQPACDSTQPSIGRDGEEQTPNLDG